ncbi:transcriptional regulator BetI [Octadecabacter ascidiaceicola]|uniref:Transcriptional regulator BetI n=2 Tax=Octadecabacter ascidiaceicola TaxID=1655543 RepID=A0A238JSE4_9RHOB|nr:transcriptional regulator BetI [Octadecabacter ascidiaceicola]
MQALVHCVARFGIEGATLAAIAEEAGLSRPSIRHHLGNRDDILKSLQDYVLKAFRDQTDALASALPDDEPAMALIDILFSDAGGTDPELTLAFAALTARSADDIDLRTACRASISQFEARIAQAIKAEQPRADQSTCDQSAQGIAALYFNVMSLSPLAMSGTWKTNARENALKLLKNLKEPKCLNHAC